MGIRKEGAFTERVTLMADLFRILSHGCRIQIISLLLIHGSRTVGELTEDIPALSQSSISEHVRILRESNFIEGQQVGTSIRYQLVEDSWTTLTNTLEFFSNEENIKSLARFDANDPTANGGNLD